jgi:hypothetical protein
MPLDLDGPLYRKRERALYFLPGTFSAVFNR